MAAFPRNVTDGTIRIGDRVVNDVPPKDRDIAMVFQNYALYPHMTVYKNMAFALKLRKVPRKEIEDRVREAARMLGIESVPVWVRPESFSTEISELVGLVGEPLADPAWIPTALLARRAAQDFPHGLIVPIASRRRMRRHFHNNGSRIHAILYGHTHVPTIKYKNGIFFFNPGSVAGKFPAPIKSFGRLTIDGSISGEIITLDEHGANGPLMYLPTVFIRNVIRMVEPWF
jgi:hypothetical protein